MGIQPYLPIGAATGGAKKAIAWYKSVFGATVKCAFEYAAGIGHAELAIADCGIMISDQVDGYSKSADMYGGTPIVLVIEFDKTSKAVFDKAVVEGAKVIKEYKEQPYGWASGTIEDPFGYQWNVTEDVKHWSNEEISTEIKMKDVAGEL
jgi:uncharacterized glyoxalase superfamily protein PhnB